MRLRRDNFGSTCIGALFNGLPAKDKLCGVLLRRAPALELKESGAGNLVIVSTLNRTAQWRIRCQRNESYAMAKTGVTRIKVPEGCTAYGEEHAYQNLPRTVVFDTVLRTVGQPTIDLPAVLSDFASWAHVAELYNATISQSEAAEYHDATVLADALARRKIAELERHASSVGSYGLGTGIAIVVVVLLTTSLALWTHLRHGKSFRKLREDDEGKGIRMMDLEARTTAAEERARAAEERALSAEGRAVAAESKTAELKTELPSFVKILQDESRMEAIAQARSAQQIAAQSAAAAASAGGRRKKISDKTSGGSVGNLLDG